MYIPGGTLNGYYLDETTNWGMDLKKLKSQVDAARKEGKCVRALVYINPGNPTGEDLLSLSSLSHSQHTTSARDLL